VISRFLVRPSLLEEPRCASVGRYVAVQGGACHFMAARIDAGCQCMGKNFATALKTKRNSLLGKPHNDLRDGIHTCD
jgi:hypothetical protein